MTPAMKPARSRVGGFSLIELMVAVAVGLLIAVGMVSGFAASSAGNATNSRVAEFRTNGRYATDFLRRELQHSGYLGINSNLATAFRDDSLVSANDYGCGAGFATNIREPISGANDSNPFSGSCIPSANYARGDILVVRRVGLQPILSVMKAPASGTVAATYDANTLYVRSEYCRAKVFRGNAPLSNVAPSFVDNGCGNPFEDYPLQTDVYYVSPYTNSATESPKIPALYRLTLGSGPALTAQLIASGIENMQVQYGITASGGTRFLDASAVAAADWPNVVAVRLWLLARSSTVEPGYANTSSYAMGDRTGDNAYTVNDGFQRQVFPLVVQLRR